MDMEPDFDPDQIDKSVQFCTDGINVASVAFFPVGILGAWLSQTPKTCQAPFCVSAIVEKKLLGNRLSVREAFDGHAKSLVIRVFIFVRPADRHKCIRLL
jgi:hypothetical protein